LLARAIHTYGAERQRYFARLDAERLPADLLGDLLFGPRGRQLGLATVYLREPAMLPREWQARLADTLRHGENPDSPRVIVGMTRDPRGEIQAGRLLEELYCVVSPMTIELPPLRERLAELPQLIDIFLAQANELEPHGAKSFSGETMSALRAYAWPGNLCELQGVVLSACRRTKTEKIELAHVPFYLKQGELPAERRLPLDTLLEQVEKRLIALALRLAQGNQTRAAEILEVWRPRLLRRMEKFGYKTETDQGPP
jgi:DNA-binding NtrC family response regulator